MSSAGMKAGLRVVVWCAKLGSGTDCLWISKELVRRDATPSPEDACSGDEGALAYTGDGPADGDERSWPSDVVACP